MFICTLGIERKPKKSKKRHPKSAKELPGVFKVHRNGRTVFIGLKPATPQPNLTESQNEDRYREAIAQHTARIQAQKQAIKDAFIGPRISKKQRAKLARTKQPNRRNVKPVLTYQERDAVLKKLFNWDYQTYLQSNLWKGVRRAVMHRDSCRCRNCSKRASEVHHTDYNAEVLRGRQNEKLVALCRTCHVNAEFDQLTGRKRSLKEANQILGFSFL